MEQLLDSRGQTEAQAIAAYRSKNYPKPALTADVVVMAREEERLQVLLIRRGNHPSLGKLAFPGGFANENEPIEETAARELEEETGVSGLPLELIGIFSAPGRDPRGWVVTGAYLAWADAQTLQVRAGDDAAEADWYEIRKEGPDLWLQKGETKIPLSQLAFDHEEILKKALVRMGVL